MEHGADEKTSPSHRRPTRQRPGLLLLTTRDIVWLLGLATVAGFVLGRLLP